MLTEQIARRGQRCFCPHLPHDSCAFTVPRRGMQGVLHSSLGELAIYQL